MTQPTTPPAQEMCDNAVYASPPSEQLDGQYDQNLATPTDEEKTNSEESKLLLENSKKDFQYLTAKDIFLSAGMYLQDMKSLIDSRHCNPQSTSSQKSARSENFSSVAKRQKIQKSQTAKLEVSSDSTEGLSEWLSTAWTFEGEVPPDSVKMLTVRLIELLDESFVQALVPTRRSSRLVRVETETQTQFDNAGDSAELVPQERDSSESQDSNYAVEKRSPFFGKLVRDALQYLVDHRENCDEMMCNEREHTQPVVNRIISAILSTLKNFVSEIIQSRAPADSGILKDHVELCYYAETDHGRKGPMIRCPDSLLYLAGKEAGGAFLDQEALSLGQLVSLEHKTWICDKNKLDTAVLEIERDFMHKVTAEDFLEPPIGYHIITDGIDWIFVRLSVIAEKASFVIKHEWKSVSILSDDKSFDFTELSEWFLVALQESLVKAKSQSEFEALQNEELWEGAQLKVNQFIRCGRRGIARVSSTGEFSMRYVVKLPLFTYLAHRPGKAENVPQKQLREARRVIAEQQYLKMFEECTAMVSVAAGIVPTPAWAILLEDAGVGLDRSIVSGNAGKELAKVALKDIWDTALTALEAQEVCHADIHQGNICIGTDKNGSLKATLVDLESAVRYGINLDASPIRFRNKKVVKASSLLDRAAVCAILECLWQNRSFDELEKRVLDLCDCNPDSNEPAIITTIRQSQFNGNNSFV